MTKHRLAKSLGVALREGRGGGLVARVARLEAVVLLRQRWPRGRFYFGFPEPAGQLAGRGESAGCTTAGTTNHSWQVAGSLTAKKRRRRAER